MSALAHRPYPTATITLMPRDIELILRALNDSRDDCQQFDETQMAAELAVLIRRLDRAAKDLITH
ncbi:MAG: hypothetical protein EBR88_00030 [Betaproteobacteria bacterium]|nr:hypothetical protein [Betaproteobacteria bacterium]